MKLYLSSYRVPTPDDLFGLVGKKPEDTKVALIPNAKDYYAEKPRNIKVGEVVEAFKALSVAKPEVVDLRNFASSSKLQKVLDDFDLVWAMGGNTFMLRYEMKRSGFDDAIKQVIKNGKVYGGESAGALVAGNSLRGIEYADPADFAEELIWSGIKLIDHFILPHVGNGPFSLGIEKARQAHKGDKAVIELTDTQALIVDGDNMKVTEAQL